MLHSVSLISNPSFRDIANAAFTLSQKRFSVAHVVNIWCYFLLNDDSSSSFLNIPHATVQLMMESSVSTKQLVW